MQQKFFRQNLRNITTVLPNIGLVSLGFMILVSFMGFTSVGLGYSDNPEQYLATNNLAPTVQASEVSTQKLKKTSKVEENFEIIIPKIDLEKKVVKNVHPAVESEYMQAIEHNVAHGKYTRLPDQATDNGNVYLFAHRTGYENGRDFGYFRNLDKLGGGDIVKLKYNGKTYEYKFKESFVIQPDDTWVYTGRSDTPTLTLQTCENGEAQRLIVKLDLVRVR